MKIFEDKVYNEMDWLEAACQPINDPINELLAKIPDENEIPLLKMYDMNRHNFDIDDILNRMSDTYGTAGYTDKKYLEKCFAFEITGAPQLNTLTKEITGGSIKLKKIKAMFSEEEVEERIGYKTLDDMRRISLRDVKRENINEILELLGLHEARKSRSIKVKCNAVVDEITNIFAKNEWRIKDMRLSNMVGVWLIEYIHNDNLAALSNFCKLKGMIHAGQPIYSINEEQEI